jgi:protein-disulfide isomerase
MKWRGVSRLLILAVLVATILAGCGGAESGGSSQAPEKQQQASRTAGSPEQKAGGAGSSGQALRGRLGHPAIGDADAPVVLTEYSDYQ